jgi:hypothetical protein
MARRCICVVAASLALVAAGAGTASAAITITQTNSPDPVARGGTVTSQMTIANTGGPSEPDVRARASLTRPGGSEAGVDNSYLSFTSTQGNCAPAGAAAACELGTLAPGASVTLSATIEANESFAQTVTAFKCPNPTSCDFPTVLASSSEPTQVNYPTVEKGSGKIKLNGVPESCTNSSFKLKARAKAKKVSRMYAYLNGPESEFGIPLPGPGVRGRIKKTESSRLKAKVSADTLDPGFYQLKVSAKRSGGQLTRTATFQVCGPTFRLG